MAAGIPVQESGDQMWAGADGLQLQLLRLRLRRKQLYLHTRPQKHELSEDTRSRCFLPGFPVFCHLHVHAPGLTLAGDDVCHR